MCEDDPNFFSLTFFSSTFAALVEKLVFGNAYR